MISACQMRVILRVLLKQNMFHKLQIIAEVKKKKSTMLDAKSLRERERHHINNNELH